MKLYSLTIRGIKFYFEAQISDEKCKFIDKTCQLIQQQYLTDCPEDIFALFVKIVSKEMKISVIPIEISHVFRIG